LDKGSSFHVNDNLYKCNCILKKIKTCVVKDGYFIYFYALLVFVYFLFSSLK